MASEGRVLETPAGSAQPVVRAPRLIVLGTGDGLRRSLVARLGDHAEVVDSLDIRDVGDLQPSLARSAADGVVYVPSRSREPADALARPVFAACAASPIAQLILVSSAAVNEPNAHHPGLVAESRTLSSRNGNRVPRRWLELESRAREELAGTGKVLTVLRPTAVPVPDGTDQFSRLIGGRIAVTLAGHDPSLQFLSVEDLAGAVVAAAERRVPGVFHVAPDGVIPLRKALRLAGARRLPLPHWLQRIGRKALSAPGLAAPIDELQYLRFGWTVSDNKIRRVLGFRPRHSGAQAVRILRAAAANGEPPAPTGALEFDDHGMDKDYIAAFGRTLFRFLHDFYWRVEVRGLEHVPRHGRAVLAGMHRGFMPWDGVMTVHLLVRELGRYPRFLIHPSLLRFPFLFNYMTKLGGLIACQENADRILERGGLLGMYPEGIQGAFRMYREAYKLGKFGRNEFVRMALRHGAPIVPYVTVGSVEIFPIVGRIDWSWWKRFTEWPFFPITVNGPFVPLPSKWHTRFLEPILTEGVYPPEAADDRATVRAISDEVRRRMTAAIEELLRRRRSIFYGSVFDDASPGEAAP